MRIGGLHKNSLIDYPGMISAVVFTQGCNFRCPYCHNPSLVYPEQYGPVVNEEVVLDFLKRRQGLLDGVVVSGGEPLLQPDIEAFIRELKSMGYRVKLDTNGSIPERLRELLNKGLVDYVAMDYKAPLRSYSRVAGVVVDTENIRQSINLIVNSGVEYEMRTTLYSGIGMNSVIDMIAELRSFGVEHYYLQLFRSFSNGSNSLQPTGIDIQYLREYLLCHFWKSGVRNHNFNYETLVTV